MCVLFFLYMFVKKMRYLRYCDTKAKNWRSDAIYRQKSTIPTTIPYDTECDTISPAVRTRKLTNGVITPFVRYYSLSKVRYRAKKNAIPPYFLLLEKMRYRAILRYQLAHRKYDTKKKPTKFFYSAGDNSVS